MSKKSVFGAFGRLSAAVAFAVAGVLGLAGTASADDVCGNGTDACKVEMTVGYEFAIEDTAKIEVVNPQTLGKTELLTNGLTVAGDDKDKVGTLGILKVTTTSDAWDVNMTTKWGGKLVYESDPVPNGNMKCRPGFNEDPWNSSNCQKPGSPDEGKIADTDPGDTKSLVYINNSLSTDGKLGAVNAGGASDNDTVQLYVRIGICDLGADLDAGATPGAYYGLGAPKNYTDYPSVPITSGALAGSAKYDAIDPYDVVTQEPISFAKVISTAYSLAPDISKRNLFWSDIASNNFKIPKIIPPNPSGASPAPVKHEQHFYINVGMNNTVDILEKKDTNGSYSETFTFELTYNL